LRKSPLPLESQYIPIWDGVFNPLIGCEPVSTGCYSCYAALLSFLRARRHDGKGSGHDHSFTQMVGPWKQAQWTGRIEYFPDRVGTLLDKVSKGIVSPSGIIAACTTSDLFAEGVPFCIVDQIMAAMFLFPRHTFLVLTKRYERLIQYVQYAIQKPMLEWLSLMKKWQPDTDLSVPQMPLKNVWMGVSAENEAWVEKRSVCLPAVAELSAVPVLAAEPLLGPVSIANIPLPGWVIISGEHAAGRACYSRAFSRRPCVQFWIEDLITECLAAGIPPYVRQLGNYFWAGERGDESRLEFNAIRGDNTAEWPDSLRVRHLPQVAGSLLFSEPKDHEKRQKATRRRKKLDI
jgi:protein gp37